MIKTGSSGPIPIAAGTSTLSNRDALVSARGAESGQAMTDAVPPDAPGAKRSTGAYLRDARTPGYLHRAVELLVARLRTLEPSVTENSATAWRQYLRTFEVLLAALAHAAPERSNTFLTTAEMADRLRAAPKTLLKRKARGEVKPAFQRGKLIRWRGNEAP